MELNNRQKKVVEAIEPYILCLASAASGKALPNSTIIPTLRGPKSVGDIKIGDYLFDRNGKPTQVLGVYPQGELEVYKVYFKSGKIAECSEDHLWSYYKKPHGKKLFTNTTKEIYKEGEKNKYKKFNKYCFRVPVTKPVDL